MEAIKLSHQLLAAAGSPTTTFAPGEVIFREGDKADKMYVVLSGEVEVRKARRSTRWRRAQPSVKWP
jgi:CRP-like cAMP-binding protein